MRSETNDIDINPSVYSPKVTRLGRFTYNVNMESDRELSDLSQDKHAGFYVEAWAYKSVLDRLIKVESEMKDLQCENIALASTIDRANEVLGPNLKTDGTLGEKIERRLAQEACRGWNDGVATVEAEMELSGCTSLAHAKRKMEFLEKLEGGSLVKFIEVTETDEDGRTFTTKFGLL